ncbi:4-alpha-glucanotransferase [Ameyamaea chiangmaiensis NBRC 103196]|uniref:4-alpha-glucanotransferase n=1 Tax=Ameyamaea chiangmaiensis TaxID=442969 RepID=A0A850P702_9PROT|nr:4-alpha-glucanotransferase [Ameyamaea chiangmaiensis]MBS4074692.1 4-alpha-glucanotransferase [Ameyamaea chiangmaiensis]NVN40405.1 4-alpha-glucanotransferase [Ameyamaea chiangmaiensis]GBQ62382.1 4-alpha-glucanotransferase [Ameyamaea chiangmaiensis NBRC 103196]
MREPSLAARARSIGLHTQWHDAQGRAHRVTGDRLRALLRSLDTEAPLFAHGQVPRLAPLVTGDSGRGVVLPGLPENTPAAFEIVLESGEHVTGTARRDRAGLLRLPPISDVGYHRLDIAGQQATLAIAPRTCTTLDARLSDDKRSSWGLAAQVYALRQRNDGGIGTLSGAGALAEAAAAAGADALAISPVHAMFAANPGQFSPYSPSSRLFLNVLLADPGIVFNRATIAASMRRHHLPEGAVRALEGTPTIDWPAAATCRLQILQALYTDHIAGRDHAVLDSFIASGGEPLLNHAIFEALHAREFHRGPRGGAWTTWPAALRTPGTPEVARFAKNAARDVRYHLFLQWLARLSLNHAQQRARKAGMAIGLIVDLAVGSDPGGSQAWSAQDDFLIGLSIGAPPDALSPPGQDWALTTFSPGGLRRNGFRAFIDTLRASLASGGGIRIDHVMGMERLWVIPRGHPSSEGAYLSYPVEDMMRLVALESARHDAIVIGEDLGTVSPTFRTESARRAIMGMSVLPFERTDDGHFKNAASWPKTSVAMSGTHDLPTLRGWWLGRDLVWRDRLNQFAPGMDLAAAQAERAQTRHDLWRAMAQTAAARGDAPDITPRGADLFAESALRFVTLSPSRLALFPFEDLLGLEDQPNLPGTTAVHPNWQQRYPTGRRLIPDRADVRRRLDAMRTGRTS